MMNTLKPNVPAEAAPKQVCKDSRAQQLAVARTVMKRRASALAQLAK